MSRLFALFLMLIATPAAAWNVTTERDRMTDKTLTWAAVKDNGATLLVGCLNGRVHPRLSWDRRIGWGTIGASYRYDDGPVMPRMAMVSDDGRDLYLWLGDPGGAWQRMRASKRVRVQISGQVLDFDLQQGGAAPPKITCWE